MAVLGPLFFSVGKQCRSFLQMRLLQTSSLQCSRYDSRHLEPTFQREEFAQPLPVDDPRRFQPIKAATNEQTSSVNYNSLLQKFIRHITREGKKDRASFIVSETLKNIKLIQLSRYNRAKSDLERESIELDPVVVFTKAVDNCRPLLTTQKVKRGGVIYQVPIPIKSNYQTFRAMKWLVESANEKERGVRIWDKLAEELLAASRNEGKTVRKKQELHRLCEANRAYAHFRW